MWKKLMEDISRPVSESVAGDRFAQSSVVSCWMCCTVLFSDNGECN